MAALLAAVVSDMVSEWKQYTNAPAHILDDLGSYCILSGVQSKKGLCDRPMLWDKHVGHVTQHIPWY